MVLRARAVGFDWLRVQALTDKVTRSWRRASMGRPSRPVPSAPCPTVCTRIRNCVGRLELHVPGSDTNPAGPDWIASHRRAFEFLGDVPEAIVCDQLKSGVVLPCRDEPGLQRTCEECIQHYGAVILPAHPGEARDKATVAVGVHVAPAAGAAQSPGEGCQKG